MILYEYIRLLSFDTMVAINNVDRPKRRGYVHPQKLRNMKWEKLRNDLGYEVTQAAIHDGVMYIQVHDKEGLHRSLDNWDLVDKYFRRKDQREESRARREM